MISDSFVSIIDSVEAATVSSRQAVGALFVVCAVCFEVVSPSMRLPPLARWIGIH